MSVLDVDVLGTSRVCVCVCVCVLQVAIGACPSHSCAGPTHEQIVVQRKVGSGEPSEVDSNSEYKYGLVNGIAYSLNFSAFSLLVYHWVSVYRGHP